MKPRIKPRNPLCGMREISQGRATRKARQSAAPTRQVGAVQSGEAFAGALAQAIFSRVLLCQCFGPIRVWRSW